MNLNARSHIQLAPEAVIKNFKVESIANDPEYSELKAGRIWYNSTENAFKIAKNDGTGTLVVQTIGTGESVADASKLGIPSDGIWNDGLLSFVAETKINDAVDEINEVLNDLAPAKPNRLSGSFTISGLKTGKIAAGSDANLISYTAGQQISTITTVGTQNITIPDQSGTAFGDADVGVLDYYQDGTKVDSFDLGAVFDPTYKKGSQIYPATAAGTSAGGKIDIGTVSWYNSFSKWQRGTGTVNVALTVGEHNFQLKHIGPGFTAQTNTSTLFYDNSTLQPTVSGATFTEGTPVIKTISGVNYYTTNSTFNISLSAANCFSKTYVDNPLTISGTATASTNIVLGDSAISGVSTIPVHDETITLTNKSMSLSTANIASSTLKFSVVARNATKTAVSVDTNTMNALVDTYAAGTSTELIEYFVDEMYRQPLGAFDTIPGTITGQWNSANPLTTGNALVSLHALKPASLNFTTFSPANTADYSTFALPQSYIRPMRKVGTPKNSGTLQLKGIASADIGTKYKVEIKLPTQTGWLDMSKAFNASTYTGAEGDGCLVSKSDASGYAVFNWSCGTKTTANSGYMVMVRVTLLNSAVAITEMKETAW